MVLARPNAGNGVGPLETRGARCHGQPHKKETIMNQTHPHRAGNWLPANHQVLADWLSALVDEVSAQPQPLHPIIEDFKALIENDAEVYMLFHQMFEQVPRKPPYNKDPTGAPEVRNYHVMLQCFNAIMTRAPEYNRTGLVGFPINA